MWVAIYNNAGAGGTVRVEEFRKRADVSTAVSQFENDYTPPATGYAGIDSGWSEYTDPPNHQEWHVDRDAAPDPVLVASRRYTSPRRSHWRKSHANCVASNGTWCTSAGLRISANVTATLAHQNQRAVVRWSRGRIRARSVPLAPKPSMAIPMAM